MPDLEPLLKEFLNFRQKVNLRTGNDQYEAWRERDHDDMAFSIMMAAWLAAYANEVRAGKV